PFPCSLTPPPHPPPLHSFPTRRSSDLRRRPALRRARMAREPVLQLPAPVVSARREIRGADGRGVAARCAGEGTRALRRAPVDRRDRKSTRLNSSHRTISYAVFCLKKKK